MTSRSSAGEWARMGATLSDKTARKKFGLTQDEIVSAIEPGRLQYRVGSVHGNPWLRLLRRELEELMATTYNDLEYKRRRAKSELSQVNRDLKQLRAHLAMLEQRRAELLAAIGE